MEEVAYLVAENLCVTVNLQFSVLDHCAESKITKRPGGTNRWRDGCSETDMKFADTVAYFGETRADANYHQSIHEAIQRSIKDIEAKFTAVGQRWNASEKKRQLDLLYLVYGKVTDNPLFWQNTSASPWDGVSLRDTTRIFYIRPIMHNLNYMCQCLIQCAPLLISQECNGFIQKSLAKLEENAKHGLFTVNMRRLRELVYLCAFCF
jgi:hypothetical protein